MGIAWDSCLSTLLPLSHFELHSEAAIQALWERPGALWDSACRIVAALRLLHMYQVSPDMPRRI